MMNIKIGCFLSTASQITPLPPILMIGWPHWFMNPNLTSAFLSVGPQDSEAQAEQGAPCNADSSVGFAELVPSAGVWFVFIGI